MNQIRVVTHSDRIDSRLEPYRETIGKDYAGYRNHVYRTTSYAMHFLRDDETYRELVETAFVYHDIALWTDKACAYLEPSEALALEDNARHGWGLDHDALRAAIHWHHKIWPYRGPHESVVEACRKADWVDANMGKIRKGLSRGQIREVEAALPYEGFHQSLIRLAGENGGSTAVGLLKVSRGILKW